MKLLLWLGVGPLVLFPLACGRGETHAASRQEPALARDASPFVEAARIRIPRVKGRLDHVAYDSKRNRAWIAAREEGSIEVVDLAARKHVLSLAGYDEAQGIHYLPEVDRVVVACGAAGTLEVFDAETGDSVASVVVGRDADGVRYEDIHQRVMVGWGAGSIAVVDTNAWKVISAFALTSHPEGFVLAKDGERLFVNLPEEKKVVELSRSEKRLTNSWPLGERRGNYPLLAVQDDTRLLVGVRDPSTLVTLDATTGKVLASETMSTDVDDLFEDAARQRVYAACGEGFVDVFQLRSDGHWRRSARHPTRKGARTALWVQATGRLLVAVPAAGGAPAELLVLETSP
ncbi:MAG: hypothetical protein L6Q99_14155 [Planctomycetes bacterium]|nr:hypothetical protein [Planctomycetota bacterium]